MSQDDYRTIDFRPAGPGWRVVHIDSAGWCRYEPIPDVKDVCSTCAGPKKAEWHLRLIYAPLPGWLVQEEHRTKERRVIAAEVDERGELDPLDTLGRWNDSAWHIMGPGDPKPTVEDVIEVRDTRAREMAAFRARQKQMNEHRLAA